MKNSKIIFAALFVLVLYSVFSIFNIFFHYENLFSIKNLTSVLENTKVNFTFDERPKNTAFLVCYDDFCKSSDYDIFKNSFFSVFEQGGEEFSRFSKITIASRDKDTLEKLNSVNIYTGPKNHYLNKSDIQKLQIKKLNIAFNSDFSEEKIEFSSITIPNITNYPGILNHIKVFVLSLFYNWQIYIIPYFWLFIAGIIFFSLKRDIKIKNEYLVLSFVFILACFLRFEGLNYYPLWLDELYTKTAATINFKSTFSDPGNPPLFYILELCSKFNLRLLPCIFGVLFVPMVYLLFRSYSKYLALFSSIFAAINTINIYHSAEARGYSLCMVLSIVSIYLFLNYLKNPNAKTLALYILSAVFMANCHYYLTLFLVSNFIWGIISLISDKKPKKAFILSHFIVLASFLPYLFVTFNRSLLSDFNSWISPLTIESAKYAINEFFLNKYIFLFFVLVIFVNLILSFVPKLKKNEDTSNMYLYLFFSFVFTLILVCIISLYIKPIFHKRLCLSLYGVYFALICMSIWGVFKFRYKTAKFIYMVILLCTFFSITSPMPLREIYNLENFMEYIKNDFPNNPKDKEIHAFIPDNMKYLDQYPKVKELSIKWHLINALDNKRITNFKKENYTNKDSVFYLTPIGVDFSRMINPDLITTKTNTTSIYKIK